MDSATCACRLHLTGECANSHQKKEPISMRLMDKDTQEQVRNLLAAVQAPVTIHMFTQEFECGYCKETSQIAADVAELIDVVALAVQDVNEDQPMTGRRHSSKIPA